MVGLVVNTIFLILVAQTYITSSRSYQFNIQQKQY